jgi:hypothetical protein
MVDEEQREPSDIPDRVSEPEPPDLDNTEGYYYPNVDIQPGKVDHPIGGNLGTTKEGKKPV